MTIAQIHEERRRQLGRLMDILKPAALATAMGVERTQLYQFRCGFRKINDEQWEKVCKSCDSLKSEMPSS